MRPSLSVRKLGSTPSTPSRSDQYVHISRSRYDSPSGPLTVIFSGRSSITQMSLTHGPTATTRCSADRATIRLYGPHTFIFYTKSGNPDPGVDPHPLGLAFGGKGPYRGLVVRVPAAVLVQDARDVLGLPVVEDVLHVGAALLFPFDESRGVADRLLLLIDLHHVVVHHLW